MIIMALNFGIAFAAGLVSFLAPCVVPLIPGFLAYLAGVSLNSAEDNRKEVFFTSVFFVLGFAVVFALLGVLLSTVLAFAAYSVQIWLSRIGGAVIILFGLYLTGLLPLHFLEREYKLSMNLKFKSRYFTAFMFGLAFAAGWTPCIGPVLGGIIGLAASAPASSFFLLMTYALGLGIPFLVVGLFATHASKFINKYAHLFKYINIVFGGILIVIGVLVFTKNLSLVANWGFLNNLLLK